MVKKCNNEHEYFKDPKNFLTYHFNKTPWNETKLANALEYCWRIGEEEVVDIEDENIKTLFELRPIHFILLLWVSSIRNRKCNGRGKANGL